MTECPPHVGLWGGLSVAGVWTLRKRDCEGHPCCPPSLFRVQFTNGKPEARPASAARGAGTRCVLASVPTHPRRPAGERSESSLPFTSMAGAPWGLGEETARCPTRSFSQLASRTHGPWAWLCALVCALGLSGPQFLHLECASSWVSYSAPSFPLEGGVVLN